MPKTNSWRVLHGDVLDVLPTFGPAAFDVLLADPPYSSGGMVRGDRAQSQSAAKYSTARRSLALHGDTRDQLQWTQWCGTWLRASTRVLKPGALVGVFVDWRQVAALYTAFGLAGIVLRGLLPWVKGKGGGRPHAGRPQQDSEFLVWGTNGPRPRVGPCFPGSFDDRVLRSERTIFCRKPLTLMRKLVQWCPADGVVLDPFAGSGPVGEAAVLEGRGVVAVDICEANADHCRDALRTLAPEREAGEL